MKTPPTALMKHAKDRTASVVAKVRRAMKQIELDIEGNDNLYPFNGGRLSKAEVCRRAGIHKVTLQNPMHRTTTSALIDTWLKALASRLISGKKSVRKAVTTRADTWREKYMAAAQQTHLYHLQMVTLTERIAQEAARVRALEAEVILLRSKLSGGCVVDA